MEIEIRRRETTGAGAAARNESETLAKYEIMDGAPVRGENIPIRHALQGVVACVDASVMDDMHRACDAADMGAPVCDTGGAAGTYA